MLLKKISLLLRDLVVLGLAVSLLSACSSNPVNEPKELDPKFKDLISLERDWKISVGEGDQELKLHYSPVLKDDKIFSVDLNGDITAIDRFSGKAVWSHNVKDKVIGGLAIDRNSIYLTTFEGFLLSLEIETGEERWRAPLTSEVIAPPAINGELVVTQSIDGKIQAFEAESGEPRWRYDSVAPILSLRGTASPLTSRRFTVSGFSNGELVMLENSDGRVLWKRALAQPKGRTELERLVDSDGQPLLDGDTIYATAYQGKVLAVSAIDGQEIWSKDISSFNKLSMGFGKLFVTTDRGEVIALDKSNGKEIWRNEDFLYRRLGSSVVFDQFVMTVDFEGYIHVLSVLDGKVLARKHPDCDGVMGDMIIYGDRVYVYARSGEIVSYQLNPAPKQEVILSPRFRHKQYFDESSFLPRN